MAWTNRARHDGDGAADLGSPALTVDQLRAAVQAAEPRAFLVPSRVIRRVIRELHEMPGLRLRLPHRKSYVGRREPLLELVDREELEVRPAELLPPWLILLPLPDQETLDETPAGDVLLKYWQLLFHAAVHADLEERLAAGRLAPADVGQWVARIGDVEFEEVRTVLDQEGLLICPDDDVRVFIEFAAVYLELERFAWGMLPRYFPAIENQAAVAEVLDEAVDGRRLFTATRLAGADSPREDAEQANLNHVLADPDAQPSGPDPVASEPSEREYEALAQSAEFAEARGNVVRALLRWHQARRVAPKPRVGLARNAAKRNLDLLVQRLKAALNLAEDDLLPWREPLAVLAEQASRGIWTREGRLLYDLQKVCVDHERNVFKIDLAAYLRTFGRQPISRPLPSQRDVLMVRHLESAIRRLTAVRLADAQRQLLHDLLREARQRSEERLRDQFRPRIVRALEAVGLVPRNLPERVARDKIAEELLDRIAERGFISMGDLRDALARNELKLPDSAGPADIFRGDPLLRADGRLAEAMDGVHRPGEFYLRWLQRLTALGFGTPTGRLITRFAALPFGGAFVLLAGILHLVGLIRREEHSIAEELPVLVPGVAVLGAFLLGLINVPEFRSAVWRGTRALFRGMRLVFYDLPRAVVLAPVVQEFLQSRWWRLAYRWALKPAVLTSFLCVAMHGQDFLINTSPQAAVGLFLAVNLLLNSRLGRDVEEIGQEWLAQAWQRFGLHVFVRLFSLIMDVSQIALEAIEQLLYTVDEWLRFRSGQSPAMFALKAVLGLFWAAFTYVVRFAVNLLIEPQINPVKHFPVVTVSHKLILPTIPYLATVFIYAMDMEKALAYTLATTIIACIPGVFGFLVWELKENWRLYASNRRGQLGRVPVGHHGETMARFLRPGFHSGTVPKRFARLRRAERDARKKGNWTSVRRHLRKLQAVEESIRHYLQREIIALVRGSTAWKDAMIEVGSIRLATNRLRIELCGVLSSGQRLGIAFSMRGGWMVAQAQDGAWLGQLNDEQRKVLGAALVGLYKAVPADLVHRQLDDRLSASGLAWDVDRRGLRVRAESSDRGEALYDLSAQGPLEPQPMDDERPPPPLPTFLRSDLLFSERPVSWDQWIAFWEAARAGEAEEAAFLLPVAVLPPAEAEEALKPSAV